MKIIKWAVLIVIVLVIVAAVVIYFNLSRIVRTTVANQSTQSLDLRTTVGGASVSLLGGSLGLSNVQIASPKGYTAPDMFTLGGVNVKVSYGQLRQNPIRIQDITISNPKLVIEQSGGKLNLQTVMDQLGAQPAQRSGSSEPMKLIVDKLQVANASVVIRPGIPGLKDEYTVDVPTVTLNDVGNGKDNQNGAAIKEVAMLLMTSLASKAADSSQVPPQLRQLLNLNVSQLGAQLQAKFNTELGRVSTELTNKLPGNVGQAVQGVLKNPQGALQNPGESLEKGLGGVLSGGGSNSGSGAGNVIGRRPATQPAKP